MYRVIIKFSTITCPVCIVIHESTIPMFISSHSITLSKVKLTVILQTWVEKVGLMGHFDPTNPTYGVLAYSLMQRRELLFCNFFSFLLENTLEPLMNLDPLLLPLLVNICPPKSLPEVFLVSPIYLSAARILKYVQDTQHKFHHDEVRTKSLQVVTT